MAPQVRGTPAPAAASRGEGQGPQPPALSTAVQLNLCLAALLLGFFYLNAPDEQKALVWFRLKAWLAFALRDPLAGLRAAWLALQRSGFLPFFGCAALCKAVAEAFAKRRLRGTAAAGDEAEEPVSPTAEPPSPTRVRRRPRRV